MKKLVCIFLAVITVLLSFAGCTPQSTNQPTQPPEEEKVFKVLLIGQSLGQDTVWFLQQVMKTEMPDREFLVADIYKSLTLGDHRRNILNNAAVYWYYKFNDTGYEKTEDVTILSALQDEWWDLVIFNDATYPTTREFEFKDGDHAFMINYIKENTKPGVKLAYNATGANPTDAELWGDGRRAAEADVLLRFANAFGGSRNLYYDKICANIKKYIETNEEFDYVFHTGTAIQYASETHGVPEADLLRDYELYRDYVHLSDFGRLLVAYQIYAQIFTPEKLENVKVNLIKKEMRATSLEQNFGDLEITQKHKDAIIASVNYALQHPNEVPPQTARPAAILECPELLP
ncbi:MAG: DUF4886 domain-containing protein [Oscillospiraceae bacterium]|nr:DUF4886 domain-containing protein [Oscillospiraceae bacterium]